MSFKLRKIIAESISEILKPEIKTHYEILTTIPSLLELRKSIKNDQPELHLSAIKIRNLFKSDDVKQFELIAREMKLDKKQISDISIKTNQQSTIHSERSPTLIFQLNPENFTKNAFQSNQNIRHKKDKVLVEFSSPNIAKPFHVGHLRSTIIGNFIGNLHQYLGNDVLKLNYLGDWGTQFGLLYIGVHLIGLSNNDIEENPIKCLYEAYVAANQAAKIDPKITEQARQVFHDLENGHLDMTRWENFRKFTVIELRRIYERLGVKFDQYDWESQYSQKDITNIINQLDSRGLILDEIDGRKIALVGDRRVPVIKSDGSTLYLARDIAALLDRFNRYQFDKMFYVVDNAQSDHFNALFTIAQGLNTSLNTKLSHIKFGRIKGMSTRQGNIVFLQDVLNEARNIMFEKQCQSQTTKVNMDDSNTQVADVLGISAVIINDLKQRRQRDYDFCWDKALQMNGDTGIKLQYTHCRLFNLLEENNQVSCADSPDWTLLHEQEARNLILEIGKFPEILMKAEETLEACVLVNYLFTLCNATSRALKVLHVKKEKCTDIQSQRLLLFSMSKEVLNQGMNILGLTPLSKM